MSPFREIVSTLEALSKLKQLIMSDIIAEGQNLELRTVSLKTEGRDPVAPTN